MLIGKPWHRPPAARQHWPAGMLGARHSVTIDRNTPIEYAEFCLFDRALPTAEVNQVRSYMSDRYAMGLSDV